MQVRLNASNAYGRLNPIALREDGWEPDMWLDVEPAENSSLPYKVTLPNGSERFIGELDIKEKRE